MRIPQRLRDCVPGAVADLQQPPAGGATAARNTVAAVLTGERTAELLEPLDRGGCLAHQDLDEPRVGRLVR